MDCNNIDPKSFENCGQKLHNADIQWSYFNLEKRVLTSTLTMLKSELDIVNKEIAELFVCLSELKHARFLKTKYTANTFHFLFTSGHNNTIKQHKRKMNELTDQLKKKQGEQYLILTDIDTIKSQIIVHNQSFEDE